MTGSGVYVHFASQVITPFWPQGLKQRLLEAKLQLGWGWWWWWLTDWDGLEGWWLDWIYQKTTAFFHFPFPKTTVTILETQRLSLLSCCRAMTIKLIHNSTFLWKPGKSSSPTQTFCDCATLLICNTFPSLEVSASAFVVELRQLSEAPWVWKCAGWHAQLPVSLWGKQWWHAALFVRKKHRSGGVFFQHAQPQRAPGWAH